MGAGEAFVSLRAEEELAQLIEETCALKQRAGNIAAAFGCDERIFTEYLADMLIYEFALLKALAKAKREEAESDADVIRRLIS